MCAKMCWRCSCGKMKCLTEVYGEYAGSTPDGKAKGRRVRSSLVRMCSQNMKTNFGLLQLT